MKSNWTIYHIKTAPNDIESAYRKYSFYHNNKTDWNSATIMNGFLLERDVIKTLILYLYGS